MASIRTREVFEKEEGERLAPFAAKSAESIGRLHAEPEHPYRTSFQRDRDRIIHSAAFRRLEYKTQVFVYHEGDHYRNRLTHTIEGAQITRTIARTLRLNEDLAEAIALAHDLGHTPFGHAGERVMASLLKAHGGFDHNRQSLRVVDVLEERYQDYAGLNLTQETREGILKHGERWSHPVPLPSLGPQRSLEAQVANIADEIAYINHDLDDALRSGILSMDVLSELPLAGDAIREVDAAMAEAPDHIRRAQMIKRIIDRLVTDLVEATAKRIEQSGILSLAEVRACENRLVAFSDSVESAKRQLKKYLYENFYLHPRVSLATDKAEKIVEDLFRALRKQPRLLPERVQGRFPLEGEIRAIADYVAGMTDRFAISEHRRLHDPPLGGGG